jgi:hypothetical protein
MTSSRAVAIGVEASVPLALAVLELVHPTWSGANIAAGVAASGGTWVPLHVGLLLGYLVLTWRLWLSVTPPATPGSHGQTLCGAARVALVVFAALNSIFLAFDGIAVGLLTTSEPAAADTLWSAPAVSLLANATGAIWSAAVLLVAAVWSSPAAPPSSPSPGAAANDTGTPARVLSPSVGRSGAADGESRRFLGAAVSGWPLLVGLALIWLTFVASTPAIGLAPLVSRLAATIMAASLVYRSGAPALPTALAIMAAVLRQHVGPEAALGLLVVAGALATRTVKRRSNLEVASPPSAG